MRSIVSNYLNNNCLGRESVGVPIACVIEIRIVACKIQGTRFFRLPIGMKRLAPLLAALLCFGSGATTLSAVEMVVGAPLTAPVSEPFSVDFDSAGVMYGVEFTKANRVFRWSPEDGKLTFPAGIDYNAEKPPKPDPKQSVGDGSEPLQARFNGMHDIQITKANLAIIGDSFNHRVRLFDLGKNTVSTIAGTGEADFKGDGGPATAAAFRITMTASLSPDQERVYIADIGNHRVRVLQFSEGTIKTVAGNGKKGLPTDGADALDTPFGDARAVAQAADGTLYVILRGGNSLVAVKDGKATTVVNAGGVKGYEGDGGPGRAAKMNGPKYVAMDASQNVLICDTENHCVRRYFPKTGMIELVAGNPPEAGNQVGDTWLNTGLRRPHGVRVSADGQLYIADTYNNRVLRGKHP